MTILCTLMQIAKIVASYLYKFLEHMSTYDDGLFVGGLRLFGSYEALEGGMTNDALVDFTGGIGYRVDLTKKHELPSDLFTRLQTLDGMSTLMSCSITVSIIRSCSINVSTLMSCLTDMSTLMSCSITVSTLMSCSTDMSTLMSCSITVSMIINTEH